MLYKFCVVHMQMNNDEFYSSTVDEINLRIGEYQNKRKQDIEMNKIAVTYGISSAFKGKNIKLFKEEEEENEPNKITTEERAETLETLNNVFGERG